MENKIKILAFVIIFIAIGGVIGYGVEYYNNFQQTKKLISGILPVRENNFNYKFIYPLLRYDFGDAKYYLENNDLENKINDYVQQQYKAGNAESISVQYTDLLSGEWAGVNANTQYSPGSLMKVLIMMDYYRMKQLDQSTLQKTFTYSNEVNHEVYTVPYTTPTNLVIGHNYTVEYLIEDMIENSDDGAAKLLLVNDNPDILKAVYQDLGMPNPIDQPIFTISPKDYTLFLRILYSSTYLTEKNSEAALSIMSQSTYKDGISAGTPPGITIAQKFGESADTNSQGGITGTELHNCGIVYAINQPYTLCIMTKAKGLVDQKKLALIIKNISSIVYNYLSPTDK